MAAGPGTKAASGTQTLPSINASTNYTLTCTWGTGSATVNWTAPTTNTDGTPLTNLAAFRVYYGTSSSSLTRVSEVNDISSSSTTISALTPATWYFKVRAVNASQIESADSNVSSKVVSGASAARTVAITITAPTVTQDHRNHRLRRGPQRDHRQMGVGPQWSAPFRSAGHAAPTTSRATITEC